MARFIAYVCTDNDGSRVEEPFEVPDEELNGLNAIDRPTRDEVISSYAQDAIAYAWDWGWSPDES